MYEATYINDTQQFLSFELSQVFDEVWKQFPTTASLTNNHN